MDRDKDKVLRIARAREALWEVVSASKPGAGRIEGDAIHVDIKINRAELKNELGKFLLDDIAAACESVIQRPLTGIAKGARPPSGAELESVALQLESAFAFQNIGAAVKRAEELRTLPNDAVKPKILMVKPHESYDREGARLHSWYTLKRSIEACGGNVIVVENRQRKDGFGQEIYTRDPLIVLEDKKTALMPDFAAFSKTHGYVPKDMGHGKALTAELGKQGYAVKTFSGYTQGGDVIYDTGRNLLLVGINADKKSALYDAFTATDAVQMGKLSGCEVMRVPRTSKEYYHLDTAVGLLPNGKYVVTPQCTDAKTMDMLRKRIGAENIIETEEVKRINPLRIDEFIYSFPANLLPVGNTLIMPACPPKLEERLRQEGYKILTPEKLGLPPESWNIGGGSVHCMTQQAMLELKHREPDAYRQALSQMLRHDTPAPAQDNTMPAAPTAVFAATQPAADNLPSR